MGSGEGRTPLLRTMFGWSVTTMAWSHHETNGLAQILVLKTGCPVGQPRHWYHHQDTISASDHLDRQQKPLHMVRSALVSPSGYHICE